ncbi:MAG TPA: hypothetical protein VK796_09215 [Cytophaga sp.]|nr:hypothetical protein [Cytophaga sp.]
MSSQQVPYDEIIRIELLVAMCLFIFIACTIYVTLGIFLGVSVYIILTYSVFFCTIVPLDLYLIRIGKYNQAKLLMMVFGSVFMFIKAASLGRDSGMNISMLIIVFATFAFYSIDDYKYILLSLSITALSIVI